MGAGRERSALTYPPLVSADLVLSVLVTGLLVGALARLAVPGPDPMPLWLTLGIGLTGSIVAAVVAQTIFHDSSFVLSLGSLLVATMLVVAYRRFVQHRPVWGPEALRFPERGLGVLGGIVGAMLLLYLYRRFAQHRPLWGPGANVPR